jgi:putative ABC transport system ATP-binding protein
MIQVNQVSKTFHEGTPKAFSALENISFEVPKAQTLILEGPSGSGKSTLLALIAGLYAPSLGEIIIDNTPISRLPEHFSAAFRRKRIGYIFQNFHLIPTLSVLDNILIPALPDKEDVAEYGKNLIEKFGLSSKINTLCSVLSGGEQQRVALIRALVRNPDIILADEPTANLDHALTKTLIEAFEVMKKEGKTLIIASHDPLLLDWNGVERLISLKHGKLA